VVWLHATPKGAKLLHAGRRRRVAALEADLAGLAPAERSTLAEATGILERVLQGRGATGTTVATGRTPATRATKGRTR
jgi:hypothetical protein